MWWLIWLIFIVNFITVINRSWKVSTCKYSSTKYNPKILWQLPFLKQSESYILKNNCKAFISQHTTSWANASGKIIGTWVSFSLSSCWDHLSTKLPFEYRGSYVLEFALHEKETENWSIDAVCSCHRMPSVNALIFKWNLQAPFISSEDQMCHLLILWSITNFSFPRWSISILEINCK